MFKSTIRGLLVFVLICLTLAPVQAAANQNDHIPEEIHEYIQQALEDWGVPGAAVSVVKDGEIVLERGYGIVELNRPERVNEHTLFGLGSITKTFTATIVARLVERGGLDWDDRVVDHLPSFRLSDPWVTENLTIRDILSHRVGLSEYENNFWAWTAFDRKDFVDRLRYLPLRESFRDNFTYSNAMITVLGELLEEVSGQSWETLVAQEVFAPAGMSRTVSSHRDLVVEKNLAPFWGARTPYGAVKGKRALRRNVSNVAVGHGYNAKSRQAYKDYDRIIPYPWHDVHTIAPAGSAVSSAHDMALYMLKYLSSDELLRPETVQVMFKKNNVYLNSHGDEKTAVGLGWFIKDFPNYREVGHDGGQIGFALALRLLPDEDIGVTVLLNRHWNFVEDLEDIIAHRIFDHLLGLPFHDLNQERLAQRAKEDQETRSRITELTKRRKASYRPFSRQLDDYAGNYNHPAFGSVEILSKKDKLYFKFSPLISGELIHVSGEIFRFSFEREILASDGDIETYLATFASGLGEDASSFKIGATDFPEILHEPYEMDGVFVRIGEE